VTTHLQYALLGLLLATGVFVGMLLLLELGRRIGRWRAAKDPDAPKVEVGALDGAVFALLGLAEGSWVHMVGFALTMALAL
jgi:hypothetical protein